MRIRLAIPDHLVTREALEAALEATSLANAAAIERGEVPLLTDALRSGIKWREEPFVDGEHFDLAHKVLERRWGDCDDLAPWLTGELRATGADEGARTRIIQTGPKRFHAVTETSDGEILDPSKWAGMGRKSRNSRQGVSGMLARPFAHVGGGALAVVPDGKRFRARCDLPWPDGSGHIASHARARTADDALNRAIAGAVVCGEQIESPLIERVCCAGEFLLSGTDVALREAHNATKTGWTFGDKRITTADANALQLYTAKGDTWLSRYGNHGNPDLEAQARIDSNREHILSDIYFAAQILDTLSKHERTWIRDKYHPHGLMHDLGNIAKGPLGFVVNPAMALSAHTLKDKQFEGARNIAANVAMPGAGGLASLANPSMLSALTKGQAVVTPPEGGQVVRADNGALSVPLESPDTQTPHGQSMFIMYHPLGNPGPVVMRF